MTTFLLCHKYHFLINCDPLTKMLHTHKSSTQFQSSGIALNNNSFGSRKGKEFFALSFPFLWEITISINFSFQCLERSEKLEAKVNNWRWESESWGEWGNHFPSYFRFFSNYFPFLLISFGIRSQLSFPKVLILRTKRGLKIANSLWKEIRVGDI